MLPSLVAAGSLASIGDRGVLAVCAHREAGLLKVLEGVTTVEEVLRVTAE
jgi:type II secretory ATPase GspE/PulE/Tfp pilus assembly ATPase PilB-like protein